MARRILRPRADVPGLAGPMVVSRADSQILAGIVDVSIARVGDAVPRRSAPDIVPVGQRDVAAQAFTRTLGRSEILHGAGNVVGYPSVGRHVIELADGER